jgi:serine/threonine protein phosphatase 1
MNKFIKRFDRNPVGRDFAVGDIHGCFGRLQEALKALQFVPDKDRLFSVGDLVDRGPESHAVLEWLEKPWFHAVQGNHEEMALVWGFRGENVDDYKKHGGKWLLDLPYDEQLTYVNALANLPYAMQIETAAGSVGVIHADISGSTWEGMCQRMHDDASHKNLEEIKETILWSRQRYMKRHAFASTIPDMHAVIVGHNTVKDALVLGNVYYLDTGGWTPQGHFTFLNLATLEVIPLKESRCAT